ncbi:unnamed protein product [Peronospora effusa]|uniref:Uncharacterized protein n=1 Tax=Peronospora farinosa TaxID=134698 RepID=A0AAV0U9E6_9STRA|nr:unnamed protein product [Peronospora effusa]CAI5732988.1 unnamed protein product [Peronospora farinosa]
MLQLRNVRFVTVTGTKSDFVAATAFKSSLMSESVEICVELFTDRTRVNEKFEASRFSSIKVISAGESSVLTISSVFRLDGTQIGRMVLIASSFEDDFVSDRLVALVEKFCDSVVTWKAQEDAVALYPVRHVQDALSAVSSSGQPPFGDSMLERVISAGRPLHTRYDAPVVMAELLALTTSCVS